MLCVIESDNWSKIPVAMIWSPKTSPQLPKLWLPVPPDREGSTHAATRTRRGPAECLGRSDRVTPRSGWGSS
jgi:hypothetical protein